MNVTIKYFFVAKKYTKPDQTCPEEIIKLDKSELADFIRRQRGKLWQWNLSLRSWRDVE